MIPGAELLLAIMAVRLSYEIIGPWSLPAFGLSVAGLILAIIDVGMVI